MQGYRQVSSRQVQVRALAEVSFYKTSSLTEAFTLINISKIVAEECEGSVLTAKGSALTEVN